MTARQHETGDQRRFAAWVREHGPAVRGFLLAMVRRPDVADDLAQEAFCRAWKARGRYSEQGTVRAYLLRIADRLVCDRARRRRPMEQLGDEGWRRVEPHDGRPRPDQAAALAEQADALTAALDELSPPQRRVLLLRYYSQMSFDQIAEHVGCPVSTVWSHCHRGLSALRKLLTDKHDGG